MFSKAMKTMERAMSVSMSAGNQRTFGVIPSAAATKVMECAMVKDVTMGTSAQKLRSGTTRQSRKRMWSMPSRMWPKPKTTKRHAA